MSKKITDALGVICSVLITVMIGAWTTTAVKVAYDTFTEDKDE